MQFTLYLALRNLLLHWNRHILTALGLIMGMTGMILFGGYVLRMEDYLATHTVYLRQVGHISLLKKDAYLKYSQNPLKFSFDQTEQALILDVLNSESSSLKISRIVPVASSQAMLTNGCQSFPVFVYGVKGTDMKWLYTHPDVQKNIFELSQFESGQGYWMGFDTLASNTTPTLWSFLNKAPLSDITTETKSKTQGATNCQNSSAKENLRFSNDLQLFAQDFYGGLGLVDTTVVGLKYSGFSLVDEVYYSAPIELVQNLVKSDNIYKLAVYFNDSADVSKKIDRLMTLFKERNIENIEIFPYSDPKMSEVYVGSMTFMMIMFLFFIVLICGVVVLTIFNSLQIAFLERKKDISIYKSIGFRNTVITNIFQMEYFLISLCSGFIAVALGAWLAQWNNSMNFRFQLPGYSSTVQFKLEPSLYYILIVFSFLIILIQGVSHFQLRRMLKQESADLMRFDS